MNRWTDPNVVLQRDEQTNKEVIGQEDIKTDRSKGSWTDRQKQMADGQKYEQTIRPKGRWKVD